MQEHFQPQHTNPLEQQTTRKHIQSDSRRQEPVSLQCVPPIVWQNVHVFPEVCAAAKQTAWLVPHFTVSQCLSVLITLGSHHTRGRMQRSLRTIADDVLAEGGPGNQAKPPKPWNH